MKTYTEPARTIPVAAETEVLIAGGGPAGIGAALGAARAGAKVMIVEQSNALGGMATGGMMSHWSGGRFSTRSCTAPAKARPCRRIRMRATVGASAMSVSRAPCFR